MLAWIFFIFALVDCKFSSKNVNAGPFHQTAELGVRGKIRRSAEAGMKECALPSPLPHGRYSPSTRRCRPQDSSPRCRMEPGTLVPDNWPLFYQCDPGYLLQTTQGEITLQRTASVCLNGQWMPMLPSCVESHYDSKNLPQFQSSSSYCGKPAQHSRIRRKVDGVESKQGAWPWIAILGIHKNGQQDEVHWFCAGTLVTTRHILTAAHCVADYRRRNSFFARFNDIDLDNKSDDKGIIDVEIQVKNIAVHPAFKRERVFSHNLAIIKMNSDLPITDFVRPICLPTPDFTGKSFDDETASLVSWGQTDNDRELTRKRRHQLLLHELRATVVNHADCNYNYRNYQSDEFIVVGWDLICASVPVNKSCQSDAGSPLMLKIKDTYVLLGVVATQGCYTEMFPRLFTRLAIYMDWIIANVKV